MKFKILRVKETKRNHFQIGVEVDADTWTKWEQDRLRRDVTKYVLSEWVPIPKNPNRPKSIDIAIGILDKNNNFDTVLRWFAIKSSVCGSDRY